MKSIAPRLRELGWGGLLIPVALVCLVLFGMHGWTVTALVLAVIAVLAVPSLAAGLVPFSLVALGLYGIAAALRPHQFGIHFAAAGRAIAIVSRPAGHVLVNQALARPGKAVLVHQALAQVAAGPLAGPPASSVTQQVRSQVPIGGVGYSTWNLLMLPVALGFVAAGLWLAPRTLAAPARRVRRLLWPAPIAELTDRVQRLTETRTYAVDGAAAELRRVEQDLHDGAQARLVALGMSLRAAEHLIEENPKAAIALVGQARETSSKALCDLRILVRGICPPVLAERGLGDAVRALALDTPLRTELEIELPERLDPPVESAAYFAVAEVLANTVKHSGAQRVQIRIRRAVGMLRIEVIDDGAGGADPLKGTGLRGVERRLGTFDGILALNSPPGGPTIVVIEVPCASSSPKTYSC
jgi:signal transduction histidine kinase